MLKTKHIATLAAVLLIGACTEDPDIANTQPTKKTTVTVMPYSASFFEAEEMPTRTTGLPEGYKTFRTLYPKTLPHHSTIGLFVTPTSTTVGENVISINEQDKWTGQLNLTNGTQYIYGFMPAEEAERATITAKDGGTFADGATIQINGLNTLTSADVCVVVGIAKGTQGTPIDQTEFNLGSFSYDSDGSNNQYVYILLDHLFAGLHFKVHIDTKYAELRTIKIKEMYLKTAHEISKTINLTVPLTANTTGQNPIGEVTYENVSSSGEGYDYAEIQLFPNENTQEEYRTYGYPVPVQTTEDFLSCFAPLTCKEFVLKTTYDVYDRNGNLIRQNCTAENKITSRHTAGFQSMKRGEIYAIDLKVQPTYIYVLSDPDLDNPTFTVE